MSKTVRYKLSGPEHKAVLDFVNQIGLPLEQVAKQSLFLAIEQAYMRAEELMAQEKANASRNSTQSEVAENEAAAIPAGIVETSGSQEDGSNQSTES